MADSKSSPPPNSENPGPRDDERTLDGSEFGNLPVEERVRSTNSSFLPKTVLAGRFRVVRFVAAGGMGEVYEAEDLELGERVAIKTIRFEYSQHENATERFKREIQLARKVTHPNVCRTFDVFRHSDGSGSGSREVLIVSMELLVGKTVSDRIREKGRLTPEEALPIILQMAAGLGAAHEAGIIHRDFKSNNVILVPAERSPDGLRAVITDFGLAKTAGTSKHLTGTFDVVGTPAYMAPEQLQNGAITPATDIYALGVVIYEMLTGSTPHNADTAVAMALKRLSEPAPSARESVPGLDPKWEATVAHCLERDPKDRFKSTDEVVRTLRGEIAPPTRRMSAGLRRITAGVPVIVALLVLAGGVAWFGKTRWLKPVDHGQAAAVQTTSKTRPAVAILGFQDLSQARNSALLGGMLTDGLWAQLDVDELRFVPPNQVDEMKRNLGIKEIKASMDAKEIARIQEYLGTQVLVTGSYRVSGEGRAGKVDWNIHLLSGKNGEGLGSIPDSGSENELHGMIARAGKRIRTNLGVELTGTEEGRLDSSFSANADALRDYSDAREKRRTFDLQGAIRSLEKSVDADPNFIQAHSALAEAWSELGYEGKAGEEAKKALDLSAKLPAEARGLVAGRYYEMTNNWAKAMQNYASLRTLFPDDPEYGLLLARSQTSAGKGQAALTTLEQTEKQNLPKGMDPLLQLAKSEAQEGLGNYHEQLKAASAAAEKAKAFQGKLLLARARIQECTALLNLGDPQKARPLCEEARALNVEAGDQLAAARAINVVANAAYQQGQLAEARGLYEQALSITENIGDKLDEAGALNNLANVMDDQGDSAGALSTYKKSIEVAKERGDKTGMALAEQNLAAVMFRSGDAAGGGKMFLSAIQISREIGDKFTEAKALNNLCIFSLSAGEAKAAAQDCEDSLRLRTEIDSKPDIARSMVSRGDIRLTAGNMAGAKEDYEGALKIQEPLGMKSDAAYSRIALAWLALREKRFADAGQYAEDAAKEFATEKDNDGEAEARAAGAEAKAGLKDFAGAQSDVETAGSLAAKSNNPELKLKIELSKARIETDSGKFAEAIARLENLQKSAQKSGFVALGMEVKLALGIAELKTSKVAQGKLLLAQLQKDAQAKGFVQIAREAAEASKS